MSGKLVSIFWVSLFLVVLCLSGCDRWIEVDAGLYVPQRPDVPLGESGAASPYVSDAGIESVFVDRDHHVVWMMFEDASLQILPFAPRSSTAWPEGCPGNINATRMEVLDLRVEALSLPGSGDAITLERPVLVRDCPSDPVELALRDDGDFGGGVACVGAQTCVMLAPASGSFLLPQAMKGYEVYSWSVEDTGKRRYTLVTGTNRSKTWEEISAPESTMTADGWVKITVEGDGALQSLLDRVPKGDEVVWVEMDL